MSVLVSSRLTRILFSCIIVLGLVSAVSADKPRLALDALPRIALAGADIRVRLTIERHAANRGFILRLSSGEYECASERDLDGEDAPRTFTVYIRNAPGGNHMLSGHLITTHGTIAATPLSIELR